MSAITLKHALPVTLLAALLHAPPTVLERFLSTISLQPKWAATLKYILRILLGLGLARSLNAALNSWAMNNWRAAAHSKWDWPNETAVVTGGSSGIGKAIVEGLAAKGVKVAILDISEPPTDLKSKPNVAYFKCDVSSLSAVTEAGEAVVSTLGHPSILVNNAGVVHRATILEKPEAHLRQVLGVNLMSMWWTTKTFLPHMVSANKGYVVTMASLASYIAVASSAEYSATKAGALAFHEGLASEIKHMYKAPGIMTTVVHPNFVRTGMTIPHAERIEKGAGKMMTIDQVSDPVLAQIFSGRGGQLILPSKLTFLSGIRGWPSWMQELLRDKFGRKAS